MDMAQTMSDCELFAHPNVTGAGCPCGLVVRRTIRPLPFPKPEPAEEHLPVFRLVSGLGSAHCRQVRRHVLVYP